MVSCIILRIDNVEYYKIGNNRKDIYNMRMFIVFYMFRNCFLFDFIVKDLLVFLCDYYIIFKCEYFLLFRKCYNIILLK